MKFKHTLAAVVSTVALSSSAFAGFTAQAGSTYSYTGGGSAISPVVGGTYTIASQSITSYTPDTTGPGSLDPQITGGDLAQFRFNVNLTVTAVNGVTGAVSTSGTYSIIYNFTNELVSGGNASLFLTPFGGSLAVATGSLQQTNGPANPAFADLAYGNNAINLVSQGGLFQSDNTFGLTLRQNAVPEPTTLAALAGASILGLRRRRA